MDARCRWVQAALLVEAPDISRGEHGLVRPCSLVSQAHTAL
jgi:hypothetical protein